MKEYGRSTPYVISACLKDALDSITRLHQARTGYDRERALESAREAILRAKNELLVTEQAVG